MFVLNIFSILTMFVYLHTSKIQCIIYRKDLYNLQTRKMSEKAQTIQIELSINNHTTRSQI